MSEATAKDPAIEAEIDARLALAEVRFGRALTDDERTAVRAQIMQGVALSATMRAVPLENGDGPGTVFVAR